VIRSRRVAFSRRDRASVGTIRPGASRRNSAASAAYPVSASAVITNGVAVPFAAVSLTVVSALIAVPPMPMPKTPTARPRLAAGNQAVTNGTPMANVVPPMPRKNPPISSPASEA
jgi:hypothetical protein